MHVDTSAKSGFSAFNLDGLLSDELGEIVRARSVVTNGIQFFAIYRVEFESEFVRFILWFKLPKFRFRIFCTILGIISNIVEEDISSSFGWR